MTEEQKNLLIKLLEEHVDNCGDNLGRNGDYLSSHASFIHLLVKEIDTTKKVWLVTTGRYSDYSIHSAWSTEELAKEAVARIKAGYDNNGYDSGVGYFGILADDLKGTLKDNEQYFRIWMNRDGQATGSEVISFEMMKYVIDEGHERHTFHPVDKNNTRFYGVCKADDVQHAFKIINERRIQWLATNQT